MKFAVAWIALVATVSAQTTDYTAKGQPDSSKFQCDTSFDSAFEIATVNLTSSDLDKRQIPTTTATCTTKPIIKLNDGVLIDQDNRQAEVVANNQFQFDDPLQKPRIYDSGFYVCKNLTAQAENKESYTLAVGGNTTFYSCNSGGFSNLYNTDIDGKCIPVALNLILCGGTSGTIVSASGASSAATSAASSAVSSAATSTPVAPPTAASPSTPAVAPAAPYPTGNSTMPAASGTGSPSSTAPGTSTTSPLTAPAGGADTLAAGTSFGAIAVVFAAFMMI
ncbi:hypothetical protein ACLMJK_005584 [Lecanora helva]